jgi:hypothetical protein
MTSFQSRRKLRSIQQGRDQTASLLRARSALATAEQQLLLAMSEARLYGRDALSDSAKKALRATERALAVSREESP